MLSSSAFLHQARARHGLTTPAMKATGVAGVVVAGGSVASSCAARLSTSWAQR
jgi:hypothetical protein